MQTNRKKTLKLTVPGLIKWESEEWTVKEVALIMGMVMVFILLLVFLLKVFILPVWGGSVALKQAGTGLIGSLKSRSP